ncbi:PadR family transcriptional regulator [Brevibacillus sp. DP1.3A]|uniref:PadR family transcriptional regulator n=1 Tax=Brevibacillus sp. DP1.3A TaxID=2738867 RepID=UPI00156B968E|nr:PadR family transcriptional regulator [Brevibacillus sp. DP1.3A]UED73952.1 PadR family transcriptional regulator [Brevibacillus sp. DP1.3A]
MSLKLLVLGLLMEGEKHPYEVQQQVKARGMDCYMKYAKGSLYYAFDQLEKSGMIEVKEVIRETSRPEKTMYGITVKGEEQFQQLLLEELQKPMQLTNPIYAALTFASYGNPQKMDEALEGNIQEVRRLAGLLESIQEEKRERLSWGARTILIGAIEHLHAEMRWMERIREEAWGR